MNNNLQSIQSPLNSNTIKSYDPRDYAKQSKFASHAIQSNQQSKEISPNDAIKQMGISLDVDNEGKQSDPAQSVAMLNNPPINQHSACSIEDHFTQKLPPPDGAQHFSSLQSNSKKSKNYCFGWCGTKNPRTSKTTAINFSNLNNSVLIKPGTGNKHNNHAFIYSIEPKQHDYINDYTISDSGDDSAQIPNILQCKKPKFEDRDQTYNIDCDGDESICAPQKLKYQIPKIANRNRTEDLSDNSENESNVNIIQSSSVKQPKIDKKNQKYCIQK